ncbi:hypothetical protein IJ596_03100 [bacterium]|nr:hypothetical protein [bacterium]
MSRERIRKEDIKNELNKLISEAEEIKEISDMYVNLIRQRILNSYCEN